ncbi:MAG: DUF5069 domain-containing protein [Candidatus Sericytochromatia bacterium]|nr:DUF5069 domain-containing protein [Candidatus Sericytochromatia bacterium]
MDLTKQPPRSPYEYLDGYVWLPRLIDKARAYSDGTLGDYHYIACPMNAHLLHFLAIESDRFAEAVAERPTDQLVLQWVEVHALPHPSDIREMFNDRFIRFRGETPAPLFFQTLHDQVAHGQRVNGFFDLLHLDDGRALQSAWPQAA